MGSELSWDIYIISFGNFLLLEEILAINFCQMFVSKSLLAMKNYDILVHDYLKNR